MYSTIFKKLLKPTVWAFFILFLLIGQLLMALPAQAADDPPAVYISYTAASDNHTHVGGVYWSAQTFLTDNTTAISVTSISILLLRTVAGNPGSVTVALRKTAAGVPTGDNLVSGILAGATMDTSEHWEKFTMASEYSLETNTTYAIVVSAPSGDNAANSIEWRKKTVGTYAGGSEYVSTNSGTTWTISSPVTCDFLFQVWGNKSLRLQDVKVFQSFRQTGDWLITARYINTVAPYYDTYDVKKYFVLQLFDLTGSTVKAQTSIPKWGNGVTNIYMSAAQVTALTYGDNYTLRLYGQFGTNPSENYTLQSTDWLGTDLTQLDSWVITSASVIGTYNNQTLTAYVAGRGEVLNATGGSMFATGISGLQTIRPQIFQIYTTPNIYTPNPTTQTYRQTTSNWQANWGPDGQLMIERLAGIISIPAADAGFVAAGFFIAMMLILALTAFPAGHTTAANVLSVIFLVTGIGFGLDLIYIILIGLFAAFLLFKNAFMDR